MLHSWNSQTIKIIQDLIIFTSTTWNLIPSSNLSTICHILYYVVKLNNHHSITLFIVLHCSCYYSWPCFFPLCPPPPRSPPSGNFLSIVCQWVTHICSLPNPFTFFFCPASCSTAFSLFHASMLLFLFCLLVYFVH